MDCQYAVKLLLRSKYLILGVLHRILADKLKLYELEQFICVWDGVESSAKVFQSFLMIHRTQSSKGISFASMIAFSFEKSPYKLRGIWDQGLGMVVDGRDSEDSILANVGMPML